MSTAPLAGLGVDREAIVGEPELCSGCDPNCYATYDCPIAPDRDDSRVEFDNVRFDALDTGIVIDDRTESGGDADGDGLIDDVDDPDNGTNVDGDADGDGIPDGYEAYLGTDMNDPADPNASGAPPSGEAYAVLPQGGDPVTRDMGSDLPVQLRSADIYFLMDTSGSMGGEIDNLTSSVEDIASQIDDPSVIEDAQFGLGEFNEFMEAGAGPYRHLVDITDDLTPLNTALSGMTTTYNFSGDYPESTTCALHAVATGAGLGVCGPGPAPACTNDGLGYPCFRPGAQPIIIVFTDDAFHNGVADTLEPGGDGAVGDCYHYTSGGCDWRTCFPVDSSVCPSLETVVGELNTNLGAKVIGVWSGGYPGVGDASGHISSWGWSDIDDVWDDTAPDTSTTYPDVDELIDLYYTVEQTGSVNDAGWPFIYGIATNGSGLGDEVVLAVQDLVATLLLDVSSTWSDPDPADPDTSVLVSSVSPDNACVTAGACTSVDATTAYGVTPGTTVTFDITLQNDAIAPGATDQVYDVLVQVFGNGTTVLGETTVHVLVPAESAPSTTGTGSYYRVYDMDEACPTTTSWRARLHYETDTPDVSMVAFWGRTAETEAGLDTAPEVSLGGTPPDLGYVYVADPLQDAGSDPRARFLGVRVELLMNGGVESPIFRNMTLEEYCETF